jgi:hypothetical protein
MTVSLWVVASAWTIAALFALYDIIAAHKTSIKLFRFFEFGILLIAALYYWEATEMEQVPSADLRLVWIALCIIICAEIISRQPWGTRKK